MNMTRKNYEKYGIVEAFENGEKTGELTYVRLSDNKIIINHTEVFDEFKGKGIAKKLVLEAIAFAKESNLKIIPSCWYAEKVFNENPEFEYLRTGI